MLFTSTLSKVFLPSNSLLHHTIGVHCRSYSGADLFDSVIIACCGRNVISIRRPFSFMDQCVSLAQA